MAKNTPKSKKKNTKSQSSNQSKSPVIRKVKRRPIQTFPSFWSEPYMLGGLVLFSVLLYFLTFNFGYILDDKIFFNENKYVKEGLAGIYKLFAEESMAGYFGGQMDLITGARYRPLSLVSFALEYQFLGLKPGFSHVVNALLYGLTGALIYYACQLFWPQEAERPWYLKIGFWAAVLFIAHPIHTEVVANIKGRDEILALLFSILTLVKAFKARKLLDYVLVGVLFYLALLSKENALTFLAVIPVSLFVFRKDTVSRDQYAKLIGVLFLAALVYLVQRYLVIGYFLSDGKEITELLNNPFVDMSGTEKYATIFYTLLKYIQLLFWPHPLSHDYYPYAIATRDWSSIASIFSLLLYMAGGIFALIKLPKRNVFAYLIFVFIATLSIVSNLPFTVGTTMNERFIYMPSIAFTLFLPYLFIEGLSRYGKQMKQIGLGLMGLALVGFSVLTLLRLPVWADALSLNRSAVEAYPNSARSSLFMGTALYNEAEKATDSGEKMTLYTEGLEYIEHSLDIYPDYGNALKMKAGVAAQMYAIDGNLQKMLQSFREVILTRPGTRYVHEYLQYLNNRGTVNSELQNFYYEIGYVELNQKMAKLSWAEKFLNYGYQLNPGNRRIAEALADTYEKLGHPDRANQVRGGR